MKILPTLLLLKPWLPSPAPPPPNPGPEMSAFGVYSIPLSEALLGQGSWQQKYYVDQALTGLQRNFAPGLLRNGFGDVASTKTRFGLAVYFGGDLQDIYKSDLYWRTCYQLSGCSP